jgi:HPt (histidine-containing phosphotransfer) domain-containing protein
MDRDISPPPPFSPGLAPDASPLGAAELAQLRREFPGAGFGEVVEMYQQEGPPLLERLATAYERLDWPALRRAAHALRGAGANFGARVLDAWCVEIETNVRAENLAVLPRLLERVREEYRRVEAALQLERHPSISHE